MKKKKKRIILIPIILVIVVLVGVIVFLNIKTDRSNLLTLEENKWIDENKYNVIDIGLFNDIPLLSYEGEGMLYNYLDYITDNHSLKFNVVSYKLDNTIEYNYKMDIVDTIAENQIELLKDNMVLITADNIQYTNVEEINNLKIGVLAKDKEKIANYLNNPTITFIEYNTHEELKNAIITTKTKLSQGDQLVDVNGIITLKTLIMKETLENDLNISYHFNDLNKYFVLTANGTKELNSILQKSYNNWKKGNLEENYNEFLLSSYYRFKNISDVEQKTLKSKNYVYGFINYGIYNYLDGKEITGLNGLVLKEFNKFSGVSIKYTQYNSLVKLINDFNSKKIDFIFDLIDDSKIKNEVYKTSNIYDKNLVVVSEVNSDVVIDSIKSLEGKTVLTIKDSYVEDYLKSNNVKCKSYNNLNDLVKEFSSSDLVVIDLENYNFYKTKTFKNSRISYFINMNENYNYLINDVEENKQFEQLFNFYLSFNSINELVTDNYHLIAYQNLNILYILIIVVVILIIYVVLDFSNHIKFMLSTIKKKNRIKMTKEEKMKYIDQLTSLKNRTYLNSRIETWDDSEVYPQSIIVIDLNNISYINDNYGREGGDKVITEAANILIQNQLANSEIIRTDGNEFLIYLVGYTEKQVISYLRKLSKEFKNLSHGFGAASGYSIIKDAIKTIDDAVNEATIAMRENKEDIDY